MSYSNFEQELIVNGYLLKGVQSIDAGYTITEKPVRVAGVGFIDALVDSPLEGSIRFSRKMVSRDPLLDTNVNGRHAFNEQEMSGVILYDDRTKGFGFNKARVSSYSVTCSAGEIPDINVEMAVYGSLGSGVNMLEPDQTHPEIQFPDQSSMRVEISDFEIDAVSDFSFSKSINLTPIYALPEGTVNDWDQANPVPQEINLDPVQIDTQYPIETNINFTIIAEEYEIKEIKDRLQAAPKSNVVIKICDAQDHTSIINSFTGFGARLISEAVNSTIDGEMSISLSYKSYETYHNPVGQNLFDEASSLSLVGDGGINVGGGEYPYGETVKIKAIPSGGYEFKNWEIIHGNDGQLGDPQSRQTTYTTSFGDATISGVYEQMLYLNIESENGVVDGEGYYSAGEIITLEAQPDQGYEFSRWNVDAGALNMAEPDRATLEFEMPDSSLTLRAEFQTKEFNISINGDSSRGSESGPQSAKAGEAVEITAVGLVGANESYRFSSWSTDPSFSIYNNTDPINITGQFIMPASDVSITANYYGIYNVNVSAVNGTVDYYLNLNDNEYNYGDKVNLLVEADDGYEFSGWVAEPSVTINKTSDSKYYFYMPDESINITANFSLKQNSVSLSSTIGSPSASPSTATMGTQVTLSEGTPEGYVFDGWTVNSGGVEITDNAFTMGSSDVSISANYKALYSLNLIDDSGSSDGISSVTFESDRNDGSITSGDTITMTIDLNEGYEVSEFLEGYEIPPVVITEV